MTFCIPDSGVRTEDGQFPATMPISVVEGAAVNFEMGRLVDKHSSLGFDTGFGECPEVIADVDDSEVPAI